MDCLFDKRIGYTSRVFNFRPVFERVAFEFLRYTGGAMQYQWNIADRGFNFLKASKIEARGAMKFVCTVARADCDCKRVAFRGSHKFRCLFWIGKARFALPPGNKNFNSCY